MRGIKGEGGLVTVQSPDSAAYDGMAIEKARAGVYPAGIVANVSEERLERFFTMEMRITAGIGSIIWPNRQSAASERWSVDDELRNSISRRRTNRVWEPVENTTLTAN